MRCIRDTKPRSIGKSRIHFSDLILGADFFDSKALFLFDRESYLHLEFQCHGSPVLSSRPESPFADRVQSLTVNIGTHRSHNTGIPNSAIRPDHSTHDDDAVPTFGRRLRIGSEDRRGRCQPRFGMNRLIGGERSLQIRDCLCDLLVIHKKWSKRASRIREMPFTVSSPEKGCALPRTVGDTRSEGLAPFMSFLRLH